jgi:hypothetical protein
MIFLSKGGEDPYINDFAKGCGASPVSTDDFIYEDSVEPIVLRGILKKKIIRQCWKDNRDFFYMDTGYFGNEVSKQNPNGWKYYHRIVKNNLQHERIINRPSDRFARFGKKINPWKTSGTKILIACPDEKPCKFYDEDLDAWLEHTISKIKSNTDRPIEIRKREKNRMKRTVEKPFLEALNDDVFALVTYNSNAAVESIFHGIPAFVTAPVHAAKPVCRTDLKKIETPYYADNDLRHAWACHLAYGQFHINEIRSGIAKELMDFE